MTKVSSTPEETMTIGKEIAKMQKPGSVVCLTGDLGAGKTIFAKGFAKGLCIEELITSPTFTLVNEYHSGRLPFYHFDVYRIERPEQMEDAGLDEYFYGEGVCLIEWAENIRDIIPKDATWIKIQRVIQMQSQTQTSNSDEPECKRLITMEYYTQ